MIQYNTPIEVTESQYNEARRLLSGIVAHRKEDGKFWLKLMVRMKRYRNELEKILT